MPQFATNTQGHMCIIKVQLDGCRWRRGKSPRPRDIFDEEEKKELPEECFDVCQEVQDTDLDSYILTLGPWRQGQKKTGLDWFEVLCFRGAFSSQVGAVVSGPSSWIKGRLITFIGWSMHRHLFFLLLLLFSSYCCLFIRFYSAVFLCCCWCCFYCGVCCDGFSSSLLAISQMPEGLQVVRWKLQVCLAVEVLTPKGNIDAWPWLELFFDSALNIQKSMAGSNILPIQLFVRFLRSPQNLANQWNLKGWDQQAAAHSYNTKCTVVK